MGDTEHNFSESSEGTNYVDTLITDFEPPELWDDAFLLFKYLFVVIWELE